MVLFGIIAGRTPYIGWTCSNIIYSTPLNLKLAGLDKVRAKTLSIEVGIQNSGLAVALALKYFSSLSALPGALFSLVQNVNGLLLSALYRKL